LVRVLTRLSGWRVSQRKGHDSLAWGILWLCGFPEIHTRACYVEALVVIEDPVYILGTGHVYDPEAERVAMFIPQYLCKQHRSERDKGLTKRVIGAKVGQSADMDFGTHVHPLSPLARKQPLSTIQIMPAGSLSICSELLTF
jgi:hypothetical protein